MADIVTPNETNVPEGFALVMVEGKKRLVPLSLPITPDGKAANLAPTNVDFGLAFIPDGTAAGAVLPGRPADANGVMFYLATNDSVTFTIATGQPAAAPAATITITGAAFAQWSEVLGPGTNIYVTAKSGAPRYRYL